MTHQDKRCCSETQDSFRGLRLPNSTRTGYTFIIQGIFRRVVGMDSEEVNHLLSHYMDDLMETQPSRTAWKGKIKSETIQEENF